MKIGVWGAGRIGAALVRRLATTTFTSEIVWTNRAFGKMTGAAIDVEQALALSPACHRVVTRTEERVGAELKTCQAVVLTHGLGVPRSGSRAKMYRANSEILRERAIPALRAHEGVVIVVTNPVDSLSRLVQKETGLPSERVLGLGTVVETARLRSALSGYLPQGIPGRDLWAFVVGTHDDNFVEVIPVPMHAGGEIQRDLLAELVPCLREEIRQAAERIKATGRAEDLRSALALVRSRIEAEAPTKDTLEAVRVAEEALGLTSLDAGTCQPIVEGVVQILEAIALDRHATLTVSALDPDADEYYSVPCTIGKGGILNRHLELLGQAGVRERVGHCIEALRIARGADDPRATALSPSTPATD